jgi:DNA modification methylase
MRHSILCGDAEDTLSGLPSRSVQCILTSPPYYRQRDYGVDGQIGAERTSDAYVSSIYRVLAECHRVLRDDGVLWLNCGDAYEDGQLLGLPWRVALSAKAAGWFVKQEVIWSKKTPMPSASRGRCTLSHEPVFMLTKVQSGYYYDSVAIEEPATHGGTKNRRSVWHLSATPYSGSHFATMPTTLAELCLLAGASQHGKCVVCGSPWSRMVEKTKLTRFRPNEFVKRTGEQGTGNSCGNSVAGVSTKTVGWKPTCECGSEEVEPCIVLDPFCGSGTTIAVADKLGLSGIGIEINRDYVELARKRVAG